MTKYKDFPEFEKAVPEVITFSDSYLDEQVEKASREKRVMWKERKEGRMPGKTKTKLGWFPPEKRIQVATAFVAGMTNATDLETISGVSASAIRNWKQKDWWRDLVERIRYEKDEELDPKFTKIIDKTLDVVADRLENGDFKLDKYGELHRVPVSMRDATQVGEKIIDKRNLLRGKPTSRVERLSDKDQLANLAKEFRRFAGAKTIEGEVIDGTIEEGGQLSGEGVRPEELAEVEEVGQESINGDQTESQAELQDS